MLKWSIVATALALAACAPKQVEDMSYTEIRQLAHEIGDRCEAQGAKYPSPEFEICKNQETRREVLRRAKAPGFGLRNSISCTTQIVGGVEKTNCS